MTGTTIEKQRRGAVSRQCGACQACCRVLEIESRAGHSTRLDTGEDLAKPAGVPCRYLTASGCSIYAVRPAVCRVFACDWLQGRHGYGPSDAPHATGVLGARGVRFHFAPERRR
jgi:Fe-S-cluster containining protein